MTSIELLIEEYRLDAVIGIYPHERLAPQPLLFDAHIFYRYHDRFLDYSEIAAKVASILCEGAFGLLEEALLVLCDTLMHEWPQIDEIELTLHKPDALPDMRVGARMRRKRLKGTSNNPL